jgi:hypothetical protein
VISIRYLHRTDFGNPEDNKEKSGSKEIVISNCRGDEKIISNITMNSAKFGKV